MNRKQRRAARNNPSPLGGYGAQARAMMPDYIVAGAPCDICGEPTIGDSRTVTKFDQNGKYLSILIRTCRKHTSCPIDELAAKLPGLINDGTPYVDLRGGAE